MGAIERATYLHFLDRELGDSVNVRVQPEALEHALKCVLLGIPATVYCGLSLLWEHPSIDASMIDLCRMAIGADLLEVVSTHPTLDEFLSTRQSLYRHDTANYPSYFGGSTRPFSPTSTKGQGTTDALHRALRGELSSPDFELATAKGLATALDRRVEEAITFTFFDSMLKNSSSAQRGGVRRQISRLYVKEYLGAGVGAIATGVEGLVYYDGLSDDFPARDVPLIGRILRRVGLTEVLARRAAELRSLWEEMLHSDEWRFRMTRAVNEILRSASQISGADRLSPGAQGRATVREALVAWSADLPRRDVSTTSTGLATSVEDAERWAASARTAVRTRALGDTSRSGVVLVMTATEIEHEILVQALTTIGLHPRPKTSGRTSYFDCGEAPRGRVLYARCRAGGATRGGSQDVLTTALSELKPDEVVMVGIAFGLDESEQPIGTVLVSDAVVNYDFVRAGTDDRGDLVIKARGTDAHAATHLVEAFRDGGMVHGERTDVGLLLSGPELVDNLEHRHELVQRHPEAIGGEMEGYGVSVACARQSVAWVLVKAVCDWGDGNKAVAKETRQRAAASSAVRRLVTFLGYPEGR